MHSQLTFSPKGLTLGGHILAKRVANGAVVIDGQEAQIQALLIAAYGKPVSPRVMNLIKRAGSLLADVQENDWNNRIPHQPNQIPTLAKAQMMLALSGLGNMEEENVPALEKTLRALQKGVPAQDLLKAYLRKDDDSDDEDDDDNEDEDDDTNSSGDSSAGSGSGGGHYNPDEPRDYHGRWTTGGTTPDTGSLSTDDIRNAITDGMNNASSLLQGTDVAGDGGIYNNKEGLLPEQPRGYYTISVIPTAGVEGAGTQRLIYGQGGEIYYTPDHYKTFQQIK